MKCCGSVGLTERLRRRWEMFRFLFVFHFFSLVLKAHIKGKFFVVLLLFAKIYAELHLCSVDKQNTEVAC